MVDILIAAIFSSFGLGYIACYHVEQYFKRRRNRIIDAELVYDAEVIDEMFREVEQLTLPLK